MTVILRVSCGLHGVVRVSTGTPENELLLRRSKWGCVFLDGVLHLLRGDAETRGCYDRSPDRNGGDTCHLEFGQVAVELPAFRIDHAEFQALGDDVLSWMMPTLHTLPWPRVASHWYSENPDHQEDLLRSLRIRMASAERCGWKRVQVLYQVPTEVRRAVGRERWAKLVREVGQG